MLPILRLSTYEKNECNLAVSKFSDREGEVGEETQSLQRIERVLFSRLLLYLHELDPPAVLLVCVVLYGRPLVASPEHPLSKNPEVVAFMLPKRRWWRFSR